MNERAAPWIQTASGRAVSLLATSASQIDITDIASHLSKVNRFVGATRAPYSVAQHSVLVSEILSFGSPVLSLYGLLHDAHEAYIGDIATPVKWAISTLCRSSRTDPIVNLCAGLDVAIHEAFSLPYPISPNLHNIIKHADARALATERRDLLDVQVEWPSAPQADPVFYKIRPWSSERAALEFLYQFDCLRQEIKDGGQPARTGRGGM